MIKEKTDKINEIINLIPGKTLRGTNILILAGAKIITYELGVTKNSYNGDKDPPWKTRLENRVKDCRKDLQRLEESKRNIYTVHEYLKEKYKHDKKCINQVRGLSKSL